MPIIFIMYMPEIETQISFNSFLQHFIFGGRKWEFNVAANMHKVAGRNMKKYFPHSSKECQKKVLKQTKGLTTKGSILSRALKFCR